MFINFLMNYYLYTNFGKILEKKLYKKISIKILEKNFKKLYNFNKKNILNDSYLFLK